MQLQKNIAIIVSAGKGLRMGARNKKQYLLLDKIPVLSRTLMKFDQCSQIHEIILVIAEEDRKYCQDQIIEPFGISKNIHIVGGGKERHDSVYNGLKKCCELIKSRQDTIVVIHDGVRPFVEDEIIIDCINKAVEYGGCVPGLKISDTVKKATNNNIVNQTMDRDELFIVQTPQTFKFDLILQAFEYGMKRSFSGTDDASFVEHLGETVYITKGSKFNIKLTTPEDLILGEQILSRIKI